MSGAPVNLRGFDARGFEDKPTALDTVIQGLYSPTRKLIVTPRRRLFAAGSVAVPAGSSNIFLQSSIITVPDSFAAGDGLIVDYAASKFFANGFAPGITVQALQIQLIGGASGNTWPIGQPTATIAQIGSGMTFVMSPSPALWSSLDLGFLLDNFSPAPLTPANPQLQVQWVATVQNTSAGALTANVQGVMFYRLVRGLEEG